jgi:uncharacterized protein
MPLPEQDAVPPSAAVPSPCISVCTMNPTTGWCDGCLRTIDEIANWSQMGDSERRAVWLRLDARRAQRQRHAG